MKIHKMEVEVLCMKSYDIFSFGFRDYKVGWLHQSFTM